MPNGFMAGTILAHLFIVTGKFEIVAQQKKARDGAPPPSLFLSLLKYYLIHFLVPATTFLNLILLATIVRSFSKYII